jgi:FkbM family methyltransferase
MIFTFWVAPSETNGPRAPESMTYWTERFREFNVFYDKDVYPILQKFGSQYADLYNRIRIQACKADLARLVLLYEYGGLYVDAHVGSGNADSLSQIFAKLTEFELVVFDKTWEHQWEGDICIINTVLCARKESKTVRSLIESALLNLAAHEAKERATSAYVPYNIYLLTGAADIMLKLFDRTPSSTTLKEDMRPRVHVQKLFKDPPERLPFFMYQFYSYRAPGKHWSERQQHERLFEMKPVELQEATSSVSLNANELAAQGHVLNHEKRYAYALALLLPGLEFGSDHYWLNFQIGRAYSGLQEREKATAYFLVAASSDYPFRVGALFEVARHDLSAGNFGRVELLDEALALPGDLAGKDEASNQKRYYYFQIQFLKAMLLLRKGDYAASNELLEVAYDFSLAVDERPFAFDWVLELFRTLPPLPNMPNLEYLRQMLLHQNMDINIDYGRELNKIPDTAVVVEIGAMDGVRFDPLHRHLVERQWNAIVVEPLPDMFELLKTTYQSYPRIRCVNAAISEVSGPLSIYRVKPEAVSKNGHGEWVVGISSAIKGATLSYLNDIVSEEVVKGLSFTDFVKELSITRIDLLQIDTEGYDWKILKQIDLRKWEIGLIHIEIINLRPVDRLAVFEEFRRSEYAFCHDGMNITAVRRERRRMHKGVEQQILRVD